MVHLDNEVKGPVDVEPIMSIPTDGAIKVVLEPKIEAARGGSAR